MSRRPDHSGNVDVASSSGKMRMTSCLLVPHDCDEAWKAITDYDRLNRFIPNLDSRVLSRSERAVMVEQKCTSSMMPFVRFHLTLEFVRESDECLSFRRVAGNLTRFDGCWLVTPKPTGTLLEYRVELDHPFLLPEFLLRRIVTADFREVMPAIASELDRRAAAA